MKPQFDLYGRVIIITGASRGIGAATAIKLASAGANLCLCGRDEIALQQVAQKARNFGSEVIELIGDITDKTFVSNIFKTVFAKFKRLDGLVNNAGSLMDASLGMIKSDKIHEAINVNLIAAIETTQLASRLMSRGDGGSIVNLTSIMATNGAPGQVVYGSAKAGIIGLTRSSSKELGQKKIRVNAISPGMIETDMLNVLDENQLQYRIENIALGKIGEPDDVANLILFLLSDMSAYITGQTIGIDGGMVI